MERRERALFRRAHGRGGTVMSARACRAWFIVESGTDARIVDALARRVDLHVLARGIPGGRAISQPTDHPVTIAGAGRVSFAWRVFISVLRSPFDAVLVQGYGVAALAANTAARLRGVRSWMLVCSPVAEYYEARRAAGYPFSPVTLAAINVLGWLNAWLGRGYVVLSQSEEHTSELQSQSNLVCRLLLEKKKITI